MRISAVLRSAAAAPLTVVRSVRIDQVLAKVKPEDCVFAKQEGPNTFSFLCFQGASQAEAATRLLSVPERERHVHTVFGRQETAVDFVLDLDFPHCTQPKGDAKYYTGESVVLDAVNSLKAYYVKQKVNDPVFIVLDGGSNDKHTYHLHVHAPGAYWTNFLALRDVAAAVNEELPVRAVDLGVYRNNGTMRCAYTPKFTEKSRMLLPLIDAKDDELRRVLTSMRAMSKEAIFARSFVTRSETREQLKELVKMRTGVSRKDSVELDHTGAPIPSYLSEKHKWKRYAEAVAAVKRLPLHAAENYNVWIRVGLSLRAFGDLPHTKNEWHAMSARCRHKYNASDVEARWTEFGKKQTRVFDWRRGYGYLVSKVKKELRSAV